MKKSILLFFALVSGTMLVMSQVIPQHGNAAFQVLRSDENEISVSYTSGQYSLNRVQTPRGEEFVVTADEALPLMVSGAPDLPFITSSVIIPDQGGFNVVVNYGEFELIENVKIAPSKGSLLRTVDPATVPYIYGDSYATDEFFPGNSLPSCSEPFILRDFRGITVKAYPYQYNPVTEQLRVYKSISLSIVKDDHVLAVNELMRTKSLTETDPDFAKVYGDFFLNYTNNPVRYNALAEGTPGRIVIMAKNTYIPDLQDYITWKTQKGHEVVLVSSDTIGTTAAVIKTWLQNYFNTVGFTYLLIVGDAQHIPPMVVNSEDSDNAFSYILGNDSYADYFVGRFSGESSADMLTQVQRTVEYERDLNESATWLGNAFGSASNEGAGQGHNGESDLQHLNLIKTDLINYGYNVTHVNQDGGSNALISTAFNSGQGLANYIGHGDVTLWVNTNFTNTQVNQLTNENKLPFIFSVACVNGEFRGQTCFAEAWLRATKNGNPTGALAFLGSTINQSWQEPMTGQDEMNDVLIDSYVNNVKRTFAGISYCGLYKMIEGGGSGVSMANTWTVFGDPAVNVRTKTPQAMAVTHDNVFMIGSSEFSLSCDADDALAALSTEVDGETILLGYAYVTEGGATISIEPFTAPGTMKLTVTGFNKITYQADITIIVPDGPYVVLDQVLIDDSDANNNGQIDYDETIYLGVELTNVGVEVAENVVLTTSTESPLVTVTDDTQTMGDITVSETITEGWAFTAVFADGIADQTLIPFALTMADANQNTWNASYNLRVNAPSLNIEFIGVNDAGTGNGNGLLDPGETAQLRFRLSNGGHADAIEGSLAYTVAGPAQTSGSPTAVDAMIVGANGEYTVGVTVDDEVTSGEMVGCNLQYVAGAYTKSLVVSVPVGLQIEDWESGDLSSFAWENDEALPWFITQSSPYEGDNCLQSGDVPSSGGESTLIILVDVVAADDVIFYKKVSCEPVSWGQYYDYLAFYIDDVLKTQWAGTVAWAQHSYPVTVGQHELKWSYVKDNYLDQGTDCAWLDFITLPPHATSVAISHQTRDIENLTVSVFPNPASDFLNLNCELPENGSLTIEIFGITGNLVRKLIEGRETGKGITSVSVPVDELPEGYYFATIRFNNEVRTVKFAIIK